MKLAYRNKRQIYSHMSISYLEDIMDKKIQFTKPKEKINNLGKN